MCLCSLLLEFNKNIQLIDFALALQKRATTGHILGLLMLYLALVPHFEMLSSVALPQHQGMSRFPLHEIFFAIASGHTSTFLRGNNIKTQINKHLIKTLSPYFILAGVCTEASFSSKVAPFLWLLSNICN